MLDHIRLFRVLVLLSRENDFFVLAQDSVTILRSLLSQIEAIPTRVQEYTARILHLEKSSEDRSREIACLKSIVAAQQILYSDAHTLEPIISHLLHSASIFWFCGPVDNDKSSLTRKAIEKWRIYHDHRDEIPDEMIQQMIMFQLECSTVLKEYFSEQLEELVAEEAHEEAAHATLPDTYLKYATYVPLGLRVPFEESTNSYVMLSDCPLTHFFVVDSKFAQLLGYSLARMLALPCISFIVNSGSFNSMVAELMHSHSSSVAIVYYRSMRRQVKAIFWEISIVENHYISRGVDITSLLHATKANETASTDKMLRQWLHSIRNASFHQQAEVLQEDIADIKCLVGDISPDLADRFNKVEEGLRTLVYTTKATVGLIDQAMETKMDKCTSVGDFVASAKAFGKRFVAREGNFFSDTLNVFELYIDGKLSPMSALGGIYVKGDMHDLKSLIDELYSNAVRFTAPNLGLKVQFHIHVLDSSIQFMVDIEDYAPDGLPDELVSFYELHLAPSKLMRIRPSSASQNQPSPDYVSSACPSCDVLSKKSSRSGIPRVVSIFYSLTANGDIDLDIRILMRPAGTIHSINFCMPILAPKAIDPIVRFDTDDPRVVLVVDDSHVVRRIVGKYLQKLNVPFHSCVDGVEALEWFMEHMDNCFGVLTDLEMPRMGGNALIDRLKQICPSMPCMIVSGNNIAVESCPPGALRAILKPITLEQIQGAVLELKSHNGALIVT